MTDLISRADAINTLETEKRCTDREEDVSGLTLAKLLISALPSAELPKGDLISRKVLMDRLESFCKWCKDGRLQGAEFVWDCIVPNVPSAEQVTSKLNNPCNSLLTEESNGSKEHKSKLDLISRADAIVAVSEAVAYGEEFIDVLQAIEKLPSAEAEQGVWEHIESPLEDNMFKCSKCGNPLKIPTVDGEPIYKYCLHCGAKMGNAWGERND